MPKTKRLRAIIGPGGGDRFAINLAIARECQKMMERGEKVNISSPLFRRRIMVRLGLAIGSPTYTKKRANYLKYKGGSLQERMRGVGLDLKYKPRIGFRSLPKQSGQEA